MLPSYPILRLYRGRHPVDPTEGPFVYIALGYTATGLAWGATPEAAVMALIRQEVRSPERPLWGD